MAWWRSSFLSDLDHARAARRITPEQALRDYYGSLSHHRPHFRRMWLLLDGGRISTAYGSFEGFKGYWKDRLATFQGPCRTLTPLVFEVADFKADKSAGKVRINAQYTLKVWVPQVNAKQVRST